MGRVSGVDGVSIAYMTEPGERPVLLVHGFASSADLTWEMTGWVRALADAGRGSVRVDLRGHGASDAPTDPASYSPALLAADLALVLDEERLSQVDVIGYSMGAQAARVLACLHPDRVRRLVLGGIGTQEQFAVWGAEKFVGALERDEPLVDPAAADLVAAITASSVIHSGAAAACIRGMAAHPMTAMPAQPTLVVAGGADDVAADAAALATQLGAQFVSIPKRTHRNAVSARAFKQAALEFLA
ncbi:MAG: alpha/beta fold hydrolase [Nakamurella sp.]